MPDARIPIVTFAESADGDLFAAHGDRPVKRWDGLLSGFMDAGVPPPTTKPVIDSSTKGAIIGDLYTYVRFLDSRGKVSNLSPRSDLHSVSVTSGAITAVTNAAPIQITSVAHGFVTGDTIKVTGVIGNPAANGTFFVTVVDDDNATLDNSAGNGDYVTGGKWTAGAGQIDYSSIEAPTDSRVTRRQILRSKDGDVNVFYVDIDTTDLTATTFTSTKVEGDLGDSVPLRADDGTDLNVSRHSEPPDFKKVIVHHYSRLFAIADLVYDEGAVDVVKDSKTVTGVATNWTTYFKGRFFYPLGTSNTKNYEIDSVDTSAQTLTLKVAYEGDTENYIGYAIRPAADEEHSVHFSEADLPESWDRVKRMFVTPDPLAGKQTSAVSLNASLYIIYEHRMYRLTFVKNPIKDGKIFMSAWRGCINQKCIVLAEGHAYMLDDKGAYRYDGEEIEEIGDMIQPIFVGGYKWSVNWDNKKFFHAAHDPTNHIIRWFVCLGGHSYPRHAIALSYRHTRWWLEEYPRPMSASAVGTVEATRKMLLGSTDRKIYAGNTGTLDGVTVESGALNGRVSESTRLGFTDSSAQFGDDQVGAPVVITSGTGSGQIRLIVNTKDRTAEIDRPWMIQPDSTSVYQIGGFKWRFTTGRMRWESEGGAKAQRGFDITFEPLKHPASLVARKYQDFETVADTSEFEKSTEAGDGVGTEIGKSDMTIDLAEPTGYVSQNFDHYQGGRTKSRQYVRIELEGTPNLEQHRVYGLGVTGVGE